MALRFSPNDPGMRLAYLLRNGVLRAQVSAGHALALGYLLAAAFGFWLYLQPQIESRLKRTSIKIMLWAGLFAAYSRGPWIGCRRNLLRRKSPFNPRAFGRLARTAAVIIVLVRGR